VWHRCGVESSAALLKALASRGLGGLRGVETSGSGHEVLAMGCREQQKGAGGLVVVLDGGGQGLDQQDRVVEGIERFCPSALVWVYEEGANPPLRGFVGTGGTVRAAIQAVSESESGSKSGSGPNGNANGSVGGSVGGPALRLSGVNGGVKSGSGLRASDVLDRDELAALLKPDK